VYGDLATCESRLKASCVTALGVTGNANTPQKVSDCAAAVATWTCDDFVIGANPPAACAQVTGSVAIGSPCSAAGQCQSGFCAYSASACGACAAAPTAGQPSTPTDQCGPALVRGANGNCQVPSKAGAACGAMQVCSAGLRCIGGTCKALDSTVSTGACGDVSGKVVGCTQGTCPGGMMPMCVARAADGAACDLTKGPFCMAPALCISGTCQHPACK